MDDLYLQILLIFVAILFAGILTGLIICSLGDDTPAEAMCGWCIHPPRKRRTTIGPNGEVRHNVLALCHCLTTYSSCIVLGCVTGGVAGRGID